MEETNFWDDLNEGLPFFNLSVEEKMIGFQVQFCSNVPFKQSKNPYYPDSHCYWFKVMYQEREMIWMISAITLLRELKKHRPLKDKILNIKLVEIGDRKAYEVKNVSEDAETVVGRDEEVVM